MSKSHSTRLLQSPLGFLKNLQEVLFLAVIGLFILCETGLAETRSLKLYYLHTGEKATIAYKQDGKFLEDGLKKVNRFLRDWRRNEPTEMDPRLLDLVWEVYEESGSKAYIHVISGYRSPATNKLLRKRGRGVASKSQHIKGKALDFYLPDVKLSNLHRIGMRKQYGGVGYYPKSGSPFVHMDTGSVRHWPKMSRSKLAKIFPNGNTLHVPSDGKPFSGYTTAKRKYESYASKASQIVIAKAGTTAKKPNFFKRLLGKDKEEDSNTIDEAEDTYANSTPAPTPVKTIEIASIPVPVQAPRTRQDNQPFAVASLTEESSQFAEEPSSLLIPVPKPRPEIAIGETTVASAANTGNAESVEVALANPEQPEEPEIRTSTRIVTPLLSPTEIQDLRQQVYAALETTPTRAAQPLVKVPEPQEIIPQVEESIVFAESSEPEVQENQMEIAKLDPVEPESFSTESPNWPEPRPGQQSAEEVVVAALNPETIQPLEPGTRSSGEIAVPLINPNRPTEIEEPTLVTALLPIEPDTRETGEIAIPISNPERSIEPEEIVEVAALEPMDENLQSSAGPAFPIPNPQRVDEPANDPIAEKLAENLIVAGIPVPQQNPNRAETLDTSIVVAALTQEIPSLAPRAISLEKLSMPDLNRNTVGKWALAANNSISRIADIRLPAYGRNAIRQLPSTVLTRGFARESIHRSADRFTGSSVEFLAFAKFE